MMGIITVNEKLLTVWWYWRRRRGRTDTKMRIILTYDVGVKRNAKVKNNCRKYLIHVQKSVFEGSIDAREYHRLRKELEKVIAVEHDQISIYVLDSIKNISKEIIGCQSVNGHILWLKVVRPPRPDKYWVCKWLRSRNTRSIMVNSWEIREKVVRPVVGSRALTINAK